MNTRLLTLLFVWMFVLPVQANNTLFSYPQFTEALNIRSVEAHDQARIWSTCAVIHEVVAMMDDKGPDSPFAKESVNRGRGAMLASGMAFIADYLENTDSPDPAAFVSKWRMAAMVMKSNYETLTTSIFSDMQSDPDGFPERLTPTLRYCIKILDVQQAYIDLWREMYGSGLFAPTD